MGNKKWAALLMILVLTMLTAGAIAERVTYVERLWNGSAVIERTKTADCAVVDGNASELSAGWHILKGDVTITSRISIVGDVHLILADGAKLMVGKGVDVPTGSSLTIYGQSRGTGELIVGQSMNAKDGHAVIGSSKNQDSGSIFIQGGTITAKGGRAGIGGGVGGDGMVTITGGTVNAVGSAGVGIGGGSTAHAEVAIHGGNVTATGVPGIGGGSFGVEITGGNVIVEGTAYCAAIGGCEYTGGSFYSDGTVVIRGGTVDATGGYLGVGIGGGWLGNATVEIHGGNITAKGGTMAPGIGGGSKRDTIKIKITDGMVVATGGDALWNEDGSASAGHKGAPGIGCSETRSANVDISGGNITAYGGPDAAGIGAGYGGVSTVKIAGGNILAVGGEGTVYKNSNENVENKRRWGAGIARAVLGVGSATIAESASIRGKNSESDEWTVVEDDESLLATHYRYAKIELEWEHLLEDGVIDLPKTGDNSMLSVWFALLGLAGVMLFMLRKRA